MRTIGSSGGDHELLVSQMTRTIRHLTRLCRACRDYWPWLVLHLPSQRYRPMVLHPHDCKMGSPKVALGVHPRGEEEEDLAPRKRFKTSDLPLNATQRSAIDSLLHTFKKKGEYDVLRKKVWAQYLESVSISSVYVLSLVSYRSQLSSCLSTLGRKTTLQR